MEKDRYTKVTRERVYVNIPGLVRVLRWLAAARLNIGSRVLYELKG